MNSVSPNKLATTPFKLARKPVASSSEPRSQAGRQNPTSTPYPRSTLSDLAANQPPTTLPILRRPLPQSQPASTPHVASHASSSPSSEITTRTVRGPTSIARPDLEHLADGERLEAFFVNGKSQGPCVLYGADGALKWRGNATPSAPPPSNLAWQQIPVAQLMPRVSLATARLKKAEPEAVEALERDPMNPYLIIRLANIWHHQEKWGQAIDLRERLQHCNIPPIERITLAMVDPEVTKDQWTKEKMVWYAAAMKYVGGLNGKIPHGEGRLTRNKDGLCLCEGTWDCGVMRGEGTVRFPDGSVYKGRLDNNRMHGPGHLKYADGSVHEGAFANDVPYGPGVAYARPPQQQIIVEKGMAVENPVVSCVGALASNAMREAEDDRIYGLRPRPYIERKLPFTPLETQVYIGANAADVAVSANAHRHNTEAWNYNEQIFNAGKSRVFVSYEIRKEVPMPVAAVARDLRETGLDPQDYEYQTRMFGELRDKVKSTHSSSKISEDVGMAFSSGFLGMPLAAVRGAAGQWRNKTIDAVPHIREYMQRLNDGMHANNIPLRWKIDFIYMTESRFQVTLERTPVAACDLDIAGLSLEERR